jgi:hypothetical protein
MKIIISKNKFIEEIKQEFNLVFPYLKIDFKLQDGNASKNVATKIVSKKVTIGDLLKDNPEGVITINEHHSIKQIAQKFAEHFGLITFFYRKSGNMWLEIKMTRDWTLKQQNESGMEVY